MSDCGNTDWIEYAHELESKIRTLQQRIAELEAERDSVCHLNDSLSLERDELAATVERLRELFLEGFSSGDDHDLDAWEEKAKAVLDITPQQSLSERDAEVARRAYSEAIASVPDLIHKGYGAGDMLALADELANEYAENVKRGE